MSDPKPENDAAVADEKVGDEPEPGSDVQSDAESEAEAEAPSEAKKKKRRKERVEPVEDLALRPLDAQGRERPLFLMEFPEDPELSRLVAAFEAGNYALIRSDAERLAERTQDARVRDAALELRRRIDPDPLIKYLLGLAAALLLFLVFYTYHSH